MSKECSGVLKAWEVTMRKTQAAKKRATNIFGAMSVAHADDEDSNITRVSSKKNDDDNGEVYTADRALSNGDYYTGNWFDNFPHGYGKYIWTDGCSYIGEWDRGKTMGKGRFSWPSGATYDGEFKTGYMDGKGTYIGSNNGDTYKGFWVMNLRHGHGLKSYTNGDYYEGEWRKGLQDGLGKYQWKNGDNYIGEWKNGVIFGFGKFVWINGNSFDGYWEDGFPKGNGTFSWNDGSCYKGIWNKDDQNQQKGTFYPSETSSEEGHREWDPQDLFNIYLNDCQICQEEKVPVLPSQKKLAVWRSSKGVNMGTRPRRVSIDGRASVGIVDRSVDRMRMIEGDPICDNDDGNSPLVEFDVDESGKVGQPMRIPKTVKRQGELIRKGHKNYELMLNLQLGIRHSVGRPAPTASLDLKASAFDPKEKVWTKFPPVGSKHTPPHQSCEFKWKDYCPVVFRSLRKLFKVDAADYMLSICGNDALRELSSPGKSGSFFYLTNDDRYMIKTMKKSEVKVLLRMLSSYYNHFRAFENTLVAKFYGLHCVKLTGQLQKKVRFIIMGNLFCSEYAIHRRYDLKGSSLGRFTDRPLVECDATTILKDLDLNFVFRLQKSWFQEFRRQIDRDCEFLEQERIMDYSLLVGLHFVESSASYTPSLPSGACSPTENELDAHVAISNADQPVQDSSSIRLGLSMPAKAERTVKRNESDGELIGEPTGEYYDVVIFFGIIDILQDYDISKKLEHAYKSMQYDSTSISAVDPRQYSRRFRDFICNSFVEDT